MIEFLIGLIIGWIIARSYKKLKVDLQDMADDLKSLIRSRKESE